MSSVNTKEERSARILEYRDLLTEFAKIDEEKLKTAEDKWRYTAVISGLFNLFPDPKPLPPAPVQQPFNSRAWVTEMLAQQTEAKPN